MRGRIMMGVALATSIATGVHAAATFKIGYQSFGTMLEYKATPPPPGYASNQRENVDGGGLAIAAEISGELDFGLNASIEAGAPMGAIAYTFERTKLVQPASGSVNSNEGDHDDLSFRSYPLFAKIGWAHDMDAHHFGLAAGAGVVLLSTSWKTTETYWNNGVTQGPDKTAPTDTQYPGDYNSFGQSVTAVPSMRLSVGYAYKLTERLRVGLDANVSPATQIRSGLPFGDLTTRSSFGVALAVSGSM